MQTNSSNNIKYSIIIYIKNCNLNDLIIPFDQLKKLYNNNFEILLINNTLNDNTLNDDILNDIQKLYLFKIILIKKIDNYNDNINKYYNYAISISNGKIIIFQDSSCIHIDNILEIIDSINEYDFLNNIYSIPIIQLQSDDDNNYLLSNINKSSKLLLIDFLNKNKNLLWINTNKPNKNNTNTNYNNKNYNNKNYNNKNYNIIFYFLIVHRDILDIVNGFNENCDKLDLNDFIIRITKITKLQLINSIIFNYFLNKNLLDSIIFCNNNDINKNINNLNNNDNVYKKREYKVGIAITIFSNNDTPLSRIEASKIFIKSLTENINDTSIIILIDKEIKEDHYEYLKDKIRDRRNIKLYKNKENYGISKSKNICIKLLEEIGIDYICLLDDDILIKKDFTEYIIRAYNNVNISLLVNNDKKIKSIKTIVNGIKFNITRSYYYYGNFICINRIYLRKYGYNILFPYKYGLEHIEFTERYLRNSIYKNHCLDISEYIDDDIKVGNKSQLSIHSIIVDNNKIKQNTKVMNISLSNIKYISFDYNKNDIEEIIL